MESVVRERLKSLGDSSPFTRFFRETFLRTTRTPRSLDPPLYVCIASQRCRTVARDRRAARLLSSTHVPPPLPYLSPPSLAIDLEFSALLP